MSSNEIELAWAAGFFDGEGCFSVHRGRNPRWDRPVVSISQRATEHDFDQPEVLVRFKEAVGCGRIYGPIENDVYRFRTSKSAEVKIILDLLWANLSDTKRAQGKRVLSECE